MQAGKPAHQLNLPETLGKLESHRSNRGKTSYRAAVSNRANNASNRAGAVNFLRLPDHPTTGHHGQSGPSTFIGSQAFSITKEELVEIVSFDNRDKESQLQLLRDKGGVEGIADSLRVSLEFGLNPTEAFEDRKATFGENIVPPPKSATLLELIWDALQDRILQILIVGAFVTLVIGLIQEPSTGYKEGVAILAAVIIVVGVTSGNDYSKEQKFKKILLLQSDKKVTVLRDGKEDQVSSWDINVGEIIILETGEEVPADGIFIHGVNLAIDESPLTGETVPMKKTAQRPFIFSGTQVSSGSGRMIVTTVGELSCGGQIQQMLNEQSKNLTPLQEKLTRFASVIGYLGFGAGALTFLGLLLRWIEFVATNPWDDNHLRFLLDYFVIAITIVVVAVPEGLPLAVTISLAFSMMKMIKDKNFVRHLSASETMGEATCICSDKTGTLTENRMTVTETFIGNKFLATSQFDRNHVPPHELGALVEGICMNSTCFVKYKEDEPLPIFVGSSTEGALLILAKRLGTNYEDVRATGVKFEENSFPFSSDRKRMTTVVVPADKSSPYRIYTKGASEIVLQLCKYSYDDNGNLGLMSDQQRQNLNQSIVRMASEGLRTLVLAYRNLDGLPIRSEDCETDLVFNALVGIKDPVREEVPGAVRDCQTAGLIVRMVTGDNILTARKIAKECGILSEGGIAMEGPEFRALSIDRKREVAPKLQVLARSLPRDKLELVRLLKEMGEVVAVTGDGTNDAPALKEADVGFAMGQAGTHIAMNASDIVLLDDNFSSIVKAIRWGRNVFDCIRKFLQFQLSVNLVAIVITFVGSVSEGSSPLSAVQLLWVNLIMDTFGALALATDDPEPEILKRPPHTRDENLITKGMVFYILMQMVFQCLALLLVLFSLYNLVTLSETTPVGRTTEIHTLLFTTFVLLQLFNITMARQLTLELNIFKGLLNNKLFLFLVFLIALIQALVVQFGGAFTSTIPLSGSEWGLCIIVSMLNMPITIVFRLVLKTFFATQATGVFKGNRFTGELPSDEETAHRRRPEPGEHNAPPLVFELQTVTVDPANMIETNPQRTGWVKVRSAMLFLSMYSRIQRRQCVPETPYHQTHSESHDSDI